MTTKDFYIELKLETNEIAIIRSNNWETTKPYVEVLIESKNQIFGGHIDRDLWTRLAGLFDRDPVEFFEENRRAITCSEETNKYKYSIRSKSESELTFVWTKELEGAVAKCGEILLRACSEQSVFNFVRNCVGIVISLTQEVKEEREKAAKATSESNTLVKEYEKILEGRVAAEEELLTKYHCLLNAKKQKIRDLQKEEY